MSEEKIETPVAEDAPKKETRAKKAEAPKRVNPVPGSPEIEGNFPGDPLYDYSAAQKMITERVRELQDEIDEIREMQRNVMAMKPTSPVRTDADRWNAQQELQRQIEAERNSQKIKVAEILKDMGLL